MSDQRITFALKVPSQLHNEAERNTLEYLSSQEGRNEYWGYVVYDEKPMLVMTDFFKVFKSCKPPVEVLLSHLPRLLPRPYSIVNSGLKDSNVLKICFSVISFKSLRKGLTTGWLEKMILNSDLTNKFNNLVLDPNGATEVNKVPIYLRKNTAQFSLPENKKNPLVLIAVGTAVAPFIGFLEELEMYKTSDPSSVTDDVWLFFGCRDPNLDHIYKKELTGFLERAGASIYVCGDLNGFKNSIKVTLQTCLVNDGKTEDEAQSLICGMEKDRRFVFDIWA
ncbi:putative nadph cytochrome p450 reductase [Operophtera brumata]|uniref:Putative nadph cytochrome p450 reductase n=1 Tax=Operophtera brumata TaxID=104452 RepID=A0A0L7KQG7_OPEBR|nr:putative nadph cytochrome p450 reductase [Operophtera brumata]